ncbi:MAG TPA: DUF1003 domain-containing protein [Acidobacteriaceae bacterium]|nr:DUF1003 domain-containing protein [Acidobacteriaceae bacterium]
MESGLERRNSAVESNIHCVADLERAFEDRRHITDRIADAIGGFTGSITFVVVHLLIFTAWFLINTGAIPHVKPFDRFPFILLSMIVSVEAVLLSTFVLMKQNRMQQKTDIRDHLNLQIDLLAEKEVTKSLQLLRAIAAKVGIDQVEDAELEEMANTTSVDSLAARIESTMTEDE